jgi:hypothetical protein
MLLECPPVGAAPGLPPNESNDGDMISSESKEISPGVSKDLSSLGEGSSAGRGTSKNKASVAATPDQSSDDASSMSKVGLRRRTAQRCRPHHQQGLLHAGQLQQQSHASSRGESSILEQCVLLGRARPCYAGCVPGCACTAGVFLFLPLQPRVA